MVVALLRYWELIMSRFCRHPSRKLALTLAFAASLPAHALIPAYPFTPDSFFQSMAALYPGTVNIETLVGGHRPGSCSGVAIGYELVLTAAHCFDSQKVELISSSQSSPSSPGLYKFRSNSQGAAAQGPSNTIETTALWPITYGQAPGSGRTHYGAIGFIAKFEPGQGPDLAIAHVPGSGINGSSSMLAKPGMSWVAFDYDPSPQGTFLAIPGHAIGYSYTDARIAMGGVAFVNREISTNTTSLGYTSTVRTQSLEAINDASHFDDPAMQGNYVAQTAVRLASGDSGGPLFLPATDGQYYLAGIAMASQGIDPSLNDDLETRLFPSSTAWTSITDHYDDVQSLMSVIQGSPTPGSSPILPLTPWQTTYSLPLESAMYEYTIDSTGSGFFYLDPYAGDFEDIAASKGRIAAIDFLKQGFDVDITGYDLATGEFVPVSYIDNGDGTVTLSKAFGRIRVVDRSISRGTLLTWGFRFVDAYGDPLYSGLEVTWSNNYTPAVPEAPPLALLLAALPLIALSGRRRIGFVVRPAN